MVASVFNVLVRSWALLNNELMMEPKYFLRQKNSELLQMPTVPKPGK
jgi:hypothetical protein